MKAAIYHGKENVAIEERPVPSCGPRDVLLKTVYASVCGTDAAVYRHGPGTGHRITVGSEFGHEAVCRVAEIGAEVTDFHVGQRVYPYPLLATGGTSRAGTMGAFSEYILAPDPKPGEGLYPVPDGIDDRTWYIQAVGRYKWSKLELQRKITANTHMEIHLDFAAEVCYTEEKPSVWSVQQMTSILFICHGNICRSPMAEFVMKDLVEKAGLESQFHIESAATSTEEIGNPVYPPARRKLAEHGIGSDGHAARQLRGEDYGRFDLLIGMDKANLRNMHRICGGDFDGKMHLLMEYAGCPGKGPQGKPSGAGCVGRGEARGRLEFSPQAETEASGPCFDEVADPWYTNDFEAAWRDVLAGCQGLLDALRSKEG